ncbi:AMP-binding protein [Saccharopolyspora shandongensis]|uniref:AMP-binding protein n=1 Tax=Saccharopolyspora shandongensis TaxID=418495 RepID=UPI00343F99A1
MFGNLVERLASLAERNNWAPRTAYVADGLRYSYGDVHEGAGRAAAALLGAGLTPGDRVLLALPDGIDFVWSFLGALRAGLVAIPVNTDLHVDELRKAEEIADPAGVICAPALASRFSAPVIDPDKLRAPGQAPYFTGGADAAGFGLFTSGTTGDPKLCFHTHADPETFEQATNSAFRLTEDDVCFSVSRMYFGFGLANSLFLPLSRGATTVLRSVRATAVVALGIIAEHRVSVFYGQPSFYAKMLETPEDSGRLASLRLAVCGGEVVPESQEAQFRTTLGSRFLNVFGTTEVGYALVANTPEAWRDRRVGKILPPYRLRVVDEDGAPVAAGEPGLLQVAGPTISLGVRKGGEPPRRLVDEWYATGDSATVDEDGFLTVHGRVDDIEIVGGTNVHPIEVEEFFLRHAAVREVAVCSVRRSVGNSTLRAYVVLVSGVSDHDQVTAELIAAVQESLTWYKVPEDVVIVPELPRNSNGKVKRSAVRKMAELDVGFQLVARHLDTTDRPAEFDLLGHSWHLLPEVFAPIHTASTELFSDWLPYPAGGSFLEIGCGAGVTAVLAALRGCARVAAVDISGQAAANTALNATRHGVGDRVSVHQGDLFGPLDRDDRFDVIFWNSNVIPTPEHFDYSHDIEHAIFDREYRAHRRYLAEGMQRLTPGGVLLLGFNSLGDRGWLDRIAAELGLDFTEYRGETRHSGHVAVTFQLLQAVMR